VPSLPLPLQQPQRLILGRQLTVCAVRVRRGRRRHRRRGTFGGKSRAAVDVIVGRLSTVAEAVQPSTPSQFQAAAAACLGKAAT
jgi:hypothetical protein